MTKELRRPRPEDVFKFTNHEKLHDRVSHERLLALVNDEDTRVHKVEETYNNYGSFLFVTVSKQAEDRRILVTFWGQGFHESRERWVMDDWYWYEAHPFPQTLTQQIPNGEARYLIEAHRTMVAGDAHPHTQTRRGQVFEMLADLTDEDGAWAEMQDLPWWLLGDDEG